MSLAPSLITSFLAGVLSITSPCIIPILPLMFAGSVGSKLRPIFLILGFSAAFTLMGGLFSVIGIALGPFQTIMRKIFIFVIIFFGLVMVNEKVENIYIKLLSGVISRITGIFQKKGSSRNKVKLFLEPFLLGVSTGIIWIPCIGPILGSILTFASYKANLLFGSLLLFSYSLGLGLPILVITYGGKHVLGGVDWVKKNSLKIKKLIGWVLIILGFLLLFGIDKHIQNYLLPYFSGLEFLLLK